MNFDFDFDFESVSVCVSICLLTHCYICSTGVLRASKGLYMNKTTFPWIAICGFAQKCLTPELWLLAVLILLTSNTVSSSPEDCTERCISSQRDRIPRDRQLL